MTAFSWPALSPPVLKLAGQFPLADSDFETRYRGDAHALHLHGYAATMRLGATLFDIAPGDLTISPAGVESAYDLPRPGRHWCVHFHPRSQAEPLARAPLHLRLGPAATYVADRLGQITRLHVKAGQGDGDALAGCTASAMLLELLLWCAARYQSSSTDHDALADRLAALIEARSAEALGVGRLASLVGVPQHTIARVFRARFGVTIPRYVIQRRMAQARYLLETSDLPIKQVGERVGIPDPQYFNKLARRLLGASPSEIREQARHSVVFAAS
ncbi:AraC family transcriptional regulator [Caulobacter sp. 1776]|uniref:helix-turn-helix transcriptional regulator n=1 Tax=Caulobacter sp. 1776 TaxID=3156420 RepID=UPI003396EB95